MQKKKKKEKREKEKEKSAILSTHYCFNFIEVIANNSEVMDIYILHFFIVKCKYLKYYDLTTNLVFQKCE